MLPPHLVRLLISSMPGIRFWTSFSASKSFCNLSASGDIMFFRSSSPGASLRNLAKSGVNFCVSPMSEAFSFCPTSCFSLLKPRLNLIVSIQTPKWQRTIEGWRWISGHCARVHEQGLRMFGFPSATRDRTTLSVTLRIPMGTTRTHSDNPHFLRLGNRKFAATHRED
ncbi:hypothetical protein M404DRAFT_511214 [Pisolithus tinctorius Marx 270]|uniref:Uncharacterized protein n=1 Tax=Pisolithus tinctorius Marx 270 TaxID=870435 RepID=A0A0C3I8H5_PISTI|nr:hypothetical protein M404DRAFT_511214 [Pisolithus tinctorius Marx 270]